MYKLWFEHHGRRDEGHGVGEGGQIRTFQQRESIKGSQMVDNYHALQAEDWIQNEKMPIIGLCKWEVTTFPVLGIRWLFLGWDEVKVLFWQGAELQVAQAPARKAARNPKRLPVDKFLRNYFKANNDYFPLLNMMLDTLRKLSPTLTNSQGSRSDYSHFIDKVIEAAGSNQCARVAQVGNTKIKIPTMLVCFSFGRVDFIFLQGKFWVSWEQALSENNSTTGLFLLLFLWKYNVNNAVFCYRVIKKKDSVFSNFLKWADFTNRKIANFT